MAVRMVNEKQKRIRETDLYAPVKTFLEQQGFDVKAEVKGCDIVAIKGDDAPIIVELKTGLTIALLLQGVDRQSISDFVYIAVPASKGRRAMGDATKLCRRLGLGLLTVRLRDGFVTALADPAPYTPRKFKKRQTALLREFQRRAGDYNTGGQTKQIIMTAYRQDALQIAAFLSEAGQGKPKEIKVALGIPNAARILQDNHYGWFERVDRGVYGLSETGRTALIENSEQVARLFDGS